MKFTLVSSKTSLNYNDDNCLTDTYITILYSKNTPLTPINNLYFFGNVYINESQRKTLNLLQYSTSSPEFISLFYKLEGRFCMYDSNNHRLFIPLFLCKELYYSNQNTSFIFSTEKHLLNNATCVTHNSYYSFQEDTFTNHGMNVYYNEELFPYIIRKISTLISTNSSLYIKKTFSFYSYILTYFSSLLPNNITEINYEFYPNSNTKYLHRLHSIQTRFSKNIDGRITFTFNDILSFYTTMLHIAPSIEYYYIFEELFYLSILSKKFNNSLPIISGISGYIDYQLCSTKVYKSSLDYCSTHQYLLQQIFTVCSHLHILIYCPFHNYNTYSIFQRDTLFQVLTQQRLLKFIYNINPKLRTALPIDLYRLPLYLQLLYLFASPPKYILTLYKKYLKLTEPFYNYNSFIFDAHLSELCKYLGIIEGEYSIDYLHNELIKKIKNSI